MLEWQLYCHSQHSHHARKARPRHKNFIHYPLTTTHCPLPTSSHARHHSSTAYSFTRVRVHLFSQRRAGRTKRQQAEHQGAASLAGDDQPQPAGAGATAAGGKAPASHHLRGRSVDREPAVPRCRPQRGRLSGEAPSDACGGGQARPPAKTHASHSGVRATPNRGQAATFPEETATSQCRSGPVLASHFSPLGVNQQRRVRLARDADRSSCRRAG